MRRLLLAALLTSAPVTEAAAHTDAAIRQRLEAIAGRWVQRRYAVESNGPSRCRSTRRS